MTQLRQRLTDVYRLHPDFKQPPQQLGAVRICSFESLLKQAQHYEQSVSPCFSVYIHGDFNSDNIIYDHLNHKINFIDLHRSGYMDYVQDVSVFMVSNYRLQVMDTSLRQSVLALTVDFYQFAAQFAQQNGDDSFELRLALGLARSFASSTRFILDKTLATAMFMRARYLIEQVLTIMDNQQRTAYRVPIQEIFLG
jgi:aminoglycoside phosphotransferase (APT) family kinase protein